MKIYSSSCCKRMYALSPTASRRVPLAPAGSVRFELAGQHRGEPASALLPDHGLGTRAGLAASTVFRMSTRAAGNLLNHVVQAAALPREATNLLAQRGCTLDEDRCERAAAALL